MVCKTIKELKKALENVPGHYTLTADFYPAVSVEVHTSLEQIDLSDSCRKNVCGGYVTLEAYDEDVDAFDPQQESLIGNKI